MKIVRTITYEGTPEQIQRQLENSLQDGVYPYLTRITVDSGSNPDWAGKRPDGWWTTGNVPDEMPLADAFAKLKREYDDLLTRYMAATAPPDDEDFGMNPQY